MECSRTEQKPYSQEIILAQFSTGFGGNVGWAIYARDRTETSSVEDVHCAYIYVSSGRPIRAHTLTVQHYTKRRNKIYISGSVGNVPLAPGWPSLYRAFCSTSFRFCSFWAVLTVRRSPSFHKIVKRELFARFRIHVRYPLNLSSIFPLLVQFIHVSRNTRAIYPVFRTVQTRVSARTSNGKEFIRLLEDPTRVLNENPVRSRLEAAFANYFSWNIRFCCDTQLTNNRLRTIGWYREPWTLLASKVQDYNKRKEI